MNSAWLGFESADKQGTKWSLLFYLQAHNLLQEHVQTDIKWKVSDLISID